MAKKKGSKQPPSAGLTVRPPEPEVVLDDAGVKSIARVVDAVHAWIDDFDDGRRTVTELMLTEVFNEDPRAMLSPDRTSHPRWLGLVRRIDAETRLTSKTLSVLARVGAYDHLVRGRYWKALEFGIKERLLPLADPKAPGGRETLSRLNAAAKHCVAFGLNGEATIRYVQAQQLLAGERIRRSAGRRTFEKQVERTLALFDGAAGLERFARVTRTLEAADREALSERLERAAKQMTTAARRLRKA